MEKEIPTKLATSASNSVTWQDVELAESYLVGGMFEEAAALASSILTSINDDKNINAGDQIRDMMASSAMVLVQSWREAGRTSDLLHELQCYFGSVTQIRVDVILTSACVQVSGGHTSRVCDFLEEFLSKWQFNNEKYFVSPSQDSMKTDVAVSGSPSTLEVDEYLVVVDFYALTLLGGALNNVDHAVLWVEKAQLPEEARQDLLRRLLSMYPVKSTSSTTEGTASSSVVEECEFHPLYLKEVKQSDKPTAAFSTQYHGGANGIKLSVWNWLQTISKRSCNSVGASNRKLLFGCLIFLIGYIIRKKRESLKRAFQKRALSLKQAVVDLWQLAFSYQVNPLAAVQPLPSANRSR